MCLRVTIYAKLMILGCDGDSEADDRVRQLIGPALDMPDVVASEPMVVAFAGKPGDRKSFHANTILVSKMSIEYAKFTFSFHLPSPLPPRTWGTSTHSHVSRIPPWQ